MISEVKGFARLVPAATAILLALLGLSWTLASPPGSSADEDFHLGSIWCAGGLNGSPCTDMGPHPSNPVTKAVTITGLDAFNFCYIGDATTSAACQLQPVGSAPLFRVNSDGLYPSGYYSFMHMFVGSSPTVSLWIMRLVSFTVSVGLLALSLAFLTRPERGRMALYWLVASVPLGLSLFASVNPSGTAVAAETAVFIAVVGVFRGLPGWKPVLPGAVAFAATIVATASRSDGLHFSALALVFGLIAGAPLRRRVNWVEVLALLPATAILVVSYLTQDLRELEVVRGESGVSWLQNLVRVTGLYANEGTTLGWRELVMPEIVWVSRTVAIGMIIAVGLAVCRRRRAVSATVVVVAMLAVPVALLQKVNYRYPEWLQARYVLALLLILVAVMALRFVSDSPTMTVPQATVIVLSMSAAHAMALHATLRRYVTGSDLGGLDLAKDAEWWWAQLPIGPMWLWAAGSLAFAALACVFAVYATRTEVGAHAAATHAGLCTGGSG